MKKILLVDVDSKIPNLALMKLAKYYKQDFVELKKLNFDYYTNNQTIIDANDYDKVFVSIIFSNNKNSVTVINCEDVTFGGSGYDLTTVLPPYIEQLSPHYRLYNHFEYSVGFITRGCNRKCSFCQVHKKEGKLKTVCHPRKIIMHNKVKFLDNNFLQCPNAIEFLQYLKIIKIKFQFNQGLDIRLITDEIAKLLSECNTWGEICFAFDNIKDINIIKNKLKILKKYITKKWKIKFFLYCNRNMQLNETIKRILWCKQHFVLPYLMRDRNCWGSEYEKFYIDLAAYCNQPKVFINLTFKEFLHKRTKDKDRIEAHDKLWNMNCF